jgi:Ca2+-dependent lipid-binding protein
LEQASKVTKRTPVDKDGGNNPHWDASLLFDIVDQYIVDVEVYEQDMNNQDALIGKCQVSLLPVFKRGTFTSWLTLKTKNDLGGTSEAGKRDGWSLTHNQ